jgi:hypothetical protein
MFQVEQACSNIAMQRTVDDHTNYMVRARPKCKMDREICGHWSASKPGRLMNSYMKIPEHGGLQGTNRVITICHLPLNHGAPLYIKGSRAPRHHAHVQRNYPYPPRTLTLQIDKHRTWANPNE